MITTVALDFDTEGNVLYVRGDGPPVIWRSEVNTVPAAPRIEKVAWAVKGVSAGLISITVAPDRNAAIGKPAAG